MKKLLAVHCWTLVLIIIAAHLLYAEQSKERVLPPLIIQSLEDIHFSPRKIDDSFSEDLFHNFIKYLDYEKKFFLQQDIDSLKKYFHLLDDEMAVGKNTFFKLAKSLIVQRIKDSKGYVAQAHTTLKNFTDKDSILIDPEEGTFAKDTADLKIRWQKRIKHRVMQKLADLVKEQEKQEEDSSKTEDSPKDSTLSEKKKPKTLVELEQEAREKVKKNYNNWYKRTDKISDNERLSLLINAMTALYDPHTNYFPPKEKEDFDINMSGQLEGIGALLREKDGFIEVVQIVPGSASQRQGELEVGDKIIAVAQGSEDPVDVVDMPLSDAVRLIRGKKGTEVRLTVEKVKGTKKVIAIERDVVIIEATYAKSALLEYGKNPLKLGYIKLPKFYADFTNQGARNCSQDVEKEISKLKKEHIQGLIFDLRNNSGGSLRDVVDIAGLFIKTGGVVQVKKRNGTTHQLRDRNPKVQYDGPLIVLINNASASASEILAAAMQDYKRGIVVGTSKSSFGKGTVQTFLNLNKIARRYPIKAGDLGALKVTTQKFYRINGGATQKKGVIPDIALPDIFQYLDMGEKEQDYVIPWDQIDPIQYDTLQPPYDLLRLSNKSKERIKNHKLFQRVEDRSKKIKEKRDRKLFTLVYKEYMQELETAEKESKSFEDMKSTLPDLSIANLAIDLKSLGTDSLKIENNKKWLEDLEKDVYLQETVMIMQDMIKE